MANPNILEHVGAYGVGAQRIDDGNTQEIYVKTKGALEAIRKGCGPQFLEIMTCRYRGHVGPEEDREWNYRPVSELDAWIAKDEVNRLASELDDECRGWSDAGQRAFQGPPVHQVGLGPGLLFARVCQDAVQGGVVHAFLLSHFQLPPAGAKVTGHG